jgi:peptidoglycan/xylan/chitin deacetylase (PgdA/CDA1 family)
MGPSALSVDVGWLDDQCMRRPSMRARPVVILLSVASMIAMVAVARDAVLDDAGSPASTTTTGERTTTTTDPTSPTSGTMPETTTRPPESTTSTVADQPAIVVRRGNPTVPVVALTFDAGSDTGHAAEILDILSTNDVVATFGMTGRWAEANPALVRRMVADGHQLVNHSYDHPSFTGGSTGDPPLSREERTDQLDRADAAIAAATGTTSVPWFRPPYGDEDASVRSDVAAAGYRYELLWTVDSLGWRGITPEDVVARCLEGAEPGAIYLLHVGAASTDHLALQRIIDGLTARGLTFATVAGMVAA